jgi:hypothetical protein
VRVRATAATSLAFADAPVAGVALTLQSDVERHNFETLGPGAPLGWVAPGAGWPVEAHGADGAEVSRAWFLVSEGRLRMRRAGVPVMMTTDVRVAASDCLFYLVSERPAGGVDEPPAGGVDEPPACGVEEPPAGGVEEPPAAAS